MERVINSSRTRNIHVFDLEKMIVVAAAVWYLLSYYKWMRDVYMDIEKLAGVPRIPIIGTEYIHIGVPKEDLYRTFLQYLEKYGSLSRTWNGSQAVVHFTEPEHVEVVINRHIIKGRIYNILRPWLGEGLLTSNGLKWSQHRKLITPTFHFQILENFMPVFAEKSELLLRILSDKADGNTHNIYPDITHCALDIICETAMGVNVNVMFNQNKKYVKSVYGLTEILTWKSIRPYIPNFLFKLMEQGRLFKEHLAVSHRFSENIIAQRKEFLKRNLGREGDGITEGRKRLSFLDLLLEASEDGGVLSDTDIREEVDTFIFEGHDTTASAMSWTICLLGNHPEIQEMLYKEIRTVLGNRLTPTTLSDLHKLKYLERVIKEALRLFPSVPVIFRHIEKDIEIDGYKLPAGTQAIIHIYALQRNAKHFPEPHKFDPDRHLPENSIERHPYAYVPFSAGPRNCIGQKFAMYEVKTIIASIINRYKVVSMETTDNPKLSTNLVLKPLNGVLVKLEKRMQK